ncbi:ABC transporter permease [Sphingobium sp. AS12]|uniref:ABC transporter permease n=1 Tax=Sphingobium sp. AS12 TaxID=2849495 RepID=UPI001C318F84|nr:ABC transporter permease [Sphingobium sp. AS12]MBV2150089.1 ABC transporter permease [Sphingobium sp. AS12]
MNTAQTIAAIAGVELLRLIRSPTSFTLLLVVPALQLLLFGHAVRPTADQVKLAVAGPAASQDRILRLTGAAGLKVVAHHLPPGSAEAMVRSGRASVAVELPTGPFAPVRTVIDASEPGLTAKAESQIQAIYWQALAERNDVADYGPRLHIERLFNPGERSDWAFLPALTGTIMMISMLMLGTLSMARERELGTWEALIAMPVNRGELLAGKIAPLVVIGSAQGVIVLALSAGIFQLPLRGSIFALVALMPIFAAAHLVLGYALASRARTQLAALQGAVAFYLPAMLLSGFLYPFETLPPWAQALGRIFPLTHFVRASRDATLRGADAGTVLLHGSPIALFLGAALMLAFAQHRARLD